MRAAALGMVLLCGIAQGAEPNSIGMELIEIPAGKFTMGSPAGEKNRRENEEPVAVTLSKPFLLGKTEVTQGQWQAVMSTEPWKGKPLVQADKDCPATEVSFFDAVEFCETLTDLERKAGKLKANEEYRLPTEAEWEYACRAGTTTAFSFGDESKLNSHAWWGGFDLEALNAGKSEVGPGNAAREQYAHKVGLKKPNPWGLHDMHGNVAEWCSDWFGEKLSGGTDPVGPEGGSGRVLRGGSWARYPVTCRSANRDYDVPSSCMLLGFRVARSQSVASAQPAAVTNSKSADAQIFSVPKLLKPQSDGAVDATYNAAWKAYELGVQAATEKLAAVMTGQFEEAVEKGDLELAEMWEAQINSLKQNGTVAMAKLPVDAVDAAQKSYEASKAKLKVEYDTLVKEYTKKKNLTRARQLRDEIDNLLKPRDDSPSPEANSIGMKLIEIPAGKFTMGSPAGEKDHQPDEGQVAVKLTKPFGLGKTEVTQGQWQQVMGTEPWKGQDYVQADKDCPATYVSFFDAVEFCETLTDLERKAGKLKANEEYRLPTEAEWEYACRAGTTTAFSFGDESKLDSHSWWGGFDFEALKAGKYEAGPGNAAREQYAHKVGFTKPNPWGLYDMHGNVAEWCSDWFGEKLSGGTDPVGPEGGSNRVYRGGGWRNYPGGCRSAYRPSYDPSDRSCDLGFRVARSQSATVAERRQQGTQAEPAPQVAAAERPVQLEENSIGMKLIVVPAGKFTMGDGSGVTVTLTKPFLMGKTEVTQWQFKKVMGTEPWEGQQFVQIDEDNAASYVDWNDATAFCQKLTDLERKAGKLKANEEYRLPTEAQWEYACRAGTTTAFSFGDESKLNSHAWWGGLDLEAVSKGEIKAGPGNAGREQYAHKVGLKKPNSWGLYDMHGNAWEWCSDWYGEKLSGGTDPVGPGVGSGRVLRGGGWWFLPVNCRSAYRNGYGPSDCNSSLGFRVARSQSETVAERRQQGAQAEPAPRKEKDPRRPFD